MKIRMLLFSATLCLGLFLMFTGNAQTPYVKQILTANGGQFEFSPPFTDFAGMQTYNPVNGDVLHFGTIYTQSVQDVLISGNSFYVTAQDSLVKFNLSTLEREAATADSGLNKLCIYNDKLIVTKQFPINTYFVEILNAADLSPVSQVEGIPGDCGGAVVVNDTLYVTVNGGWMGTQGKIAVISTTTWELVRMIELGPDAIGVFNIYPYNNKLITVNKSPYATPNKGSISVIDLANNTFINTVFDINVGNGAGICGDLLYLGLNYGLGSVNLNTLQISDTTIIPDPGSAIWKYILSAAIDTLNHLIYANIGDYVMPGTCRVTTLTGDSVTNYNTGISSDALAVDYRIAPAGWYDNLRFADQHFRIWPNPATDYLNLTSLTGKPVTQVILTDVTGKTVLNSLINQPAETICRIPLETITPGIYGLKIIAAGEVYCSKIIVR